MIEIKLTGPCEGCTQAELRLDYVEKNNIGTGREKIWFAECENEKLCAMWRARLKNENK